MLNYGEGNKHPQHDTLLCSYKLIYISTLILQIKNKEMSLQAMTMSSFTSDTRERERHLTVTVRSGSFWHSVRFSKKDIYARRCKNKAWRVIKDPNQPDNSLFSLL